MAKKGEEPRATAGEISAWGKSAVVVSNVLAALAEQLGVPTAVFTIILFPIYFFGKEGTRDEFIRMLLFGQPDQLIVRLFFATLVVTMVVAGMIRRRGVSAANKEIERLRSELNAAQKKLLEGVPTEGGPQVTNVTSIQSGQPSPVVAVK